MRKRENQEQRRRLQLAAAKELLRNNHRFSEFDLEGRVYAITGGGRGLGLSIGCGPGGELHCGYREG
jgi:hypothetical protein